MNDYRYPDGYVIEGGAIPRPRPYVVTVHARKPEWTAPVTTVWGPFTTQTEAEAFRDQLLDPGETRRVAEGWVTISVELVLEPEDAQVDR